MACALHIAVICSNAAAHAGKEGLRFMMDRNLDHYSLEPVLAQAVEERMKD